MKGSPRLVLLKPSTLWALLALAAIWLSLAQVGFQQDWMNSGGWGQFWRFLEASLHPDLSPELLKLTIHAALVTLAYAVCGTFLSVMLGVVGGVFASEVWWQAVFRAEREKIGAIVPGNQWFLGIRALFAVPRAIHEMIWGLLFVNLWGLDPLTAILAIAIPFGAITAKVFAEILDETPRQPLFALLNSGVAPLPAFCYSLFPQAFLNGLSYTFYRFECSIRSAAVLGIIGAGGLGYEIFLSLQSLRYEQLWTFFYALLVLNGCVDFGSAWLRQRLGCASRLDLNLYKKARSRKVRETDNSRWWGCGLLSGGFVLTIFCFWYVNPDWSKLWSPRTGQLFREIVASTFPPDWTGAENLLSLAGQTVAMSVLAIAIATLGGVFLAFPAASNFFLPGGLLNLRQINPLSQGWAWGGLLLSRAALLISRAIPAPIWALVLLFVLFPGILPGAIALGIHNLGILGRLMAETIENLDQRPLQALKAQGAPSSLVFLYGVLPLTLPRFLAYSLYRWEVCMRETVIVGLVGAGGLGRLLTEQLSSFDYRSLVVTLACFVMLTFWVDWLSATSRRSLR